DPLQQRGEAAHARPCVRALGGSLGVFQNRRAQSAIAPRDGTSGRPLRRDPSRRHAGRRRRRRAQLGVLLDRRGGMARGEGAARERAGGARRMTTDARALDWDEVTARLAAAAESPAGRALCLALPFADDAGEARRRMASVAELARLLRAGETLPSLAAPEIDV